MNQTTRDSGLERLNLLAGSWDVTATIDGTEMGATRTEFHWMPGAAFLIQRTGTGTDSEDATEWAENAPDSVTMIFGFDDTTDSYSALYADSRNVYRIYQMTLDQDGWTLWRDAPGFSQRFNGRFNEDGSVIHGTWEKSSDGESWDHDFDLTYTRVT